MAAPPRGAAIGIHGPEAILLLLEPTSDAGILEHRGHIQDTTQRHLAFLIDGKAKCAVSDLECLDNLWVVRIQSCFLGNKLRHFRKVHLNTPFFLVRVSSCDTQQNELVPSRIIPHKSQMHEGASVLL